MNRLRKFLFQNTSIKQTVAKNTFWLFFGEIIGRLLKLTIVIFATRKLGVEGWGTFSYAFAFVSFFFILGDFGINTFITKEMSKDNINKYKYLATSIILRLVLLSLFFTTAVLLAPNLGKIKLGFSTILVFSIFFVSESIREFAMAINRSLQKMEVEGFSKILINFSITVVGLILLTKNVDPISLAMAYMVGSIISTIYIVWSIRKEFKGIEWKFSKENFKIIYAFSWPIVIMSFFGFLFSLDTIMLGQMKSATDVGLYATAQRIIALSSVIPGFIAASIFPLLSRYEMDMEKSERIFEKSMTAVLALGIPITIAGIFFSKQIILLVFGSAYSAGAPVLSALMISILASYPNILLTNLIFSKNLQRIFITVTTFGVLLNIALNFLLIPKYGALGAALSTVIAELLIVYTTWRKMKKHIRFSVIPKLSNIAIASTIMTLSIITSNLIGIPFILTIVIATGIYMLSLKLLKEPIFNEIIALAASR